MALRRLTARIRTWVRARGRWGIAVAGAVTLVILLASFGVTMAAAGALNAKTAMTASPKPTPTGGSGAPEQPGDGKLPEGLAFVFGDTSASRKLVQSGWNGLAINFTPGAVNVIYAANMTATTMRVTVTDSNGTLIGWAESSSRCSASNCRLSGIYDRRMSSASDAICKAHSTELLVTLSGTDQDQTKQVTIPPAFNLCPGAAPSPTLSTQEPTPLPSVPDETPAPSASPSATN